MERGSVGYAIGFVTFKILFITFINAVNGAELPSHHQSDQMINSSNVEELNLQVHR